MPLVDFLYRCPLCSHDPLEGRGDQAVCHGCSTAFRRGGEGGFIRVESPSSPEREVSGRILGSLDRLDPPAREGGGVGLEASVRARISTAQKEVRFQGRLLGFAEVYQPEVQGVLRLSRDALALWPPVGGAPPLGQWDLLDIRAVQTSSRTLQISPRTGGVVAFRFPDDSLRRWEAALHRRLRERFRAEGLGEILEFQPRIVTDSRRIIRRPKKHRTMSPEGSGSSLWYGLFQGAFRLLMTALVRLEVRGVERIPKRGPMIVVANHQSFLDPALVQVVCPRPLHTLTKSTQFDAPVYGWFLPRANAIPTRRYLVDAQAVRVVLRRLAEGEAVGIYPEGERSWDGALQPVRRGTMRLLLGAGVPVVPCGISGAYDVWPRWSRRIRRRRVVISFGEPMVWPLLTTRAEREEAVPWAMETLKEQFEALGAWMPEESREGGESSG